MIFGNSILINFFTVKVSGYDVLGDLQISFPLFFCTKNSPNDIISGNVDGEVEKVGKLMKMRFFYYKDTLHFFLE
jgi:hypothetical protein